MTIDNNFNVKVSNELLGLLLYLKQESNTSDSDLSVFFILCSLSYLNGEFISTELRFNRVEYAKRLNLELSQVIDSGMFDDYSEEQIINFINRLMEDALSHVSDEIFQELGIEVPYSLFENIPIIFGPGPYHLVESENSYSFKFEDGSSIYGIYPALLLPYIPDSALSLINNLKIKNNYVLYQGKLHKLNYIIDEEAAMQYTNYLLSCPELPKQESTTESTETT